MRLAVAPILALVATSQPAPAAPINGLAAVVNGKPITHSEVRTSVQAQEFLLRRKYPAGGAEFRSELSKIQEQALQDLIDRELILSEFESSGGGIKSIYVDEELEREIRERTGGDRAKFIEELRAENMTVKGLRKLLENRMIVQTLRSQHSNRVPPPTPAEKEAYFAEHQDEFREDDLVKIRTITLYYNPDEPTSPLALTGPNGERLPGKDEQKRLADDIRKQVLNGADFGALAITHSHDSASSKGGDRGWVGKDDEATLSAQLIAIALTMNQGQVSEALDVGYGFMLVWVEDRQLGKLRPRDEIDAEVNLRVLQQKRRAAEEEWLKRLRRNASIKIY